MATPNIREWSFLFMFIILIGSCCTQSSPKPESPQCLVMRASMEACRRSASLNVVENGEPDCWQGSLPQNTTVKHTPHPPVILQRYDSMDVNWVNLCKDIILLVLQRAVCEISDLGERLRSSALAGQCVTGLQGRDG